tara:strand:+ start:2537 stop:2977 length:441 start_codon:yes stop_codon:yes gene_type:complete
MAQDSTSIVSKVGAESKVTTLFGNIVNSLSNSAGGIPAGDVTTRILNQYGGELRQISPAKYDYIYGIFQKETESEQLAKAYTLLTIDSVKTLGITVDELFKSIENPIEFTNLGLTLLNHYRPLTSQVGKTVTVSQSPDHVSRMISY